MTRIFPIPSPKVGDGKGKTLPFNKAATRRNVFTFSFARLNRDHALFNLGDDEAKPKSLPDGWYLALLDTLKEASTKNVQELKNQPFELHPVRWDKANARRPEHDEQYEYWQFRISKSKGRIIGYTVHEDAQTVFYIVWLDAHHNLTDSEGYGKAREYARPLTPYEILENENERLRAECDSLKKELEEAYALIE